MYQRRWIPTALFHSILFDRAAGREPPKLLEQPEYFADLHLDDVVASITAGREAYALAPFFYTPVRNVATIAYRQEVFRDLEDPALIDPLRSFAQDMLTVRTHLEHAAKVPYRYERERWSLDAASTYCAAVRQLVDNIATSEPRSRGMLAFREYLLSYAASDAFTRLATETEEVKTALAALSYRLRIQGGKVTVSRHDSEPDYSAEVLRTFEKFKQGAGKEYRWELDRWGMNHVQAAIVDRVALLHPAVFASLDEYCVRHREFMDPSLARFGREIQFYIAYVEHIDRFRRAGLAFCYPEINDRSGDIHARAVFDLALAARLEGEHADIVTNDLALAGPERILVVTGPNQGGKTTYARTVGQLHHLARIGVPVPGTDARLALVDQIFAHFERQEEVEDLISKLEGDLQRIQRILAAATARSLLIMNESFSSTTVGDQLFIGQRIIRKIIDCGLLCVVVTFLDELASLDPSTVSMVSIVDPEEPTRRTFKIVRRPADGLAYAMAIAEKHGLTYQSVKARVAR